MARSSLSLATFALAALATLTLAAGAQTPGPGSADSTSEDLQAELDALLREIHGDWHATDPFEDGRRPDLIVVSTSDTHGEVAPCG
ncbi:MAG: hypothetical protein KC591_11920 [Gemmatimonadetes bacterium]|nr:hypothetical protein [Gemmatimonadota bacterium]